MLCRIVPAGLVKKFHELGTNKTKELLDLGEEIAYNRRINQEKEKEHERQERLHIYPTKK